MRISSKRLLGLLDFVLVLPFLLLGSAGVFYFYVAYFGLPSDPVAMSPLPANTTVLLERRASSPFGTAEYKRSIILERDGKRIARFPLADDFGGVVEINAYLESRDRLLLTDRIAAYAIDLRRAGGPLHLPRDCGAGRPSGADSARYLGRFDGRGAAFRFIPADDQEAERAIPQECP